MNYILPLKLEKLGKKKNKKKPYIIIYTHRESRQKRESNEEKSRKINETENRKIEKNQ